jgi:hypothetical protein
MPALVHRVQRNPSKHAIAVLRRQSAFAAKKPGHVKNLAGMCWIAESISVSGLVTQVRAAPANEILKVGETGVHVDARRIAKVRQLLLY